ncbi:phosphatidylethanolamine-binding protein [Aspergillus californicus]
MPNITKHGTIVSALEDGRYPVLGLRIGSSDISRGTKISKKDTHSTPTISLPSSLDQEATYTVIAVDIDAPFASWNALSPIVHWVQTDLKVAVQRESAQLSLRLESDQSPVIPWLPAGPPPGAAPHRYIFLLYVQKQGEEIPEGLKGKPIKRAQRMRFDLDVMVEKLGLGDAVAGTSFLAN